MIGTEESTASGGNSRAMQIGERWMCPRPSVPSTRRGERRFTGEPFLPYPARPHRLPSLSLGQLIHAISLGQLSHAVLLRILSKEKRPRRLRITRTFLLTNRQIFAKTLP